MKEMTISSAKHQYFWTQQKQISPAWTPPLSLTLTAYPTTTPRSGVFFFAKMIAKDDPTIIICSHLVAETSALAGLKKYLRGGYHPPRSVHES